MAKPKRPRDTNQLAKRIVDISTGDVDETQVNEGKRRGGIVGGNARAGALTPAQRSEIASIAANARWKRRK